MKVIVSSTGNHVDAEVSPIFGRCAYFVVVDSETMQATATPNSAVGASGGAGIQSAQYVVSEGAQAVISGNVGPNAMQVLMASGISLYQVQGGTVRQAVEALKAGALQAVAGPTVSADYAKGGIGGRGGERGGGRGRWS